MVSRFCHSAAIRPEFRIPNPESRIPSPESPIPNPESRVSVVIGWRLLQLGVRDHVVLNPELRAGLFQKHLQRLPRPAGLLLIEITNRQAIQRALLGIVVEVS